MQKNNSDIIPDPQGVGYFCNTLMKGSPIRGSYSVKDGTELIMGIVFRKQEQLSALTLPKGLLAVGDASFSFCKALKEVTIPASVEYIGVAAFSCSGLESVTFLGTPKVIERNVFLGCNNLKRIIVPKGKKQCFIDCLGKEWSSTIIETNEQCKYSNKTSKMNIGKDEILPVLQEDYTLRSKLQKKGLAVQEELQQEIRHLEQQYISENIVPALEKYSRDLLKDLQCEVTLSIHKDSNGDVKVEDDKVADKICVLPLEQEPVKEESKNVSEDETFSDSVNPADEESHKTTRSGRKKFKAILDGKEITGDGATVLAETIKRIGFNRVAKLGIMMAKGEYNLVGRHKREDKGVTWQREIDGWYVYTNSTNPQKVDQLRNIAKELNLDLQVIEETPVEASAVSEEPTPQPKIDETAKYYALPMQEQAWTYMAHEKSESTANSYISTLDNAVRRYIERIEPEADSIFSFTTAEDVQAVIDLLKGEEDFHQENLNRHNSMTAALNLYLKFIQSRENE